MTVGCGEAVEAAACVGPILAKKRRGFRSLEPNKDENKCGGLRELRCLQPWFDHLPMNMVGALRKAPRRVEDPLVLQIRQF
jgi:hypothetical protein